MAFLGGGGGPDPADLRAGGLTCRGASGLCNIEALDDG